MIHATHNARYAVLATAPAVSISLLAIAAAMLWSAPSHAQRATYEQERNNYDPGIADPAAISSDTSSYSVTSAYAPSPADDFVGAYAYVGNYGSAAEDSDSNSFIRITDDVNSNGASGGIVVVQDGPDGQPQLSTLTDFGDLHEFNIGFDSVGIARQSGARAFDAGTVYWIYEEGGVRPDPDRVAADKTQKALENLPIEPTKVLGGTGSHTVFVTLPARSRLVPDYSKYARGLQGTGVGLNFGYYEFGLLDRFRFDAEGGILGRTYSDTRMNNWVTGPQAGLVAYKSFGPLRFYGHALGVVGINDGDMQQNNGIGAELVPGAFNRLLYAQPTYSEHRDAIDDISPTGILWAEAGLQVTERTSLRFAWSAIYVNNILMAEDRVRYYLPDMGLRDPGEQDYLQQLFFCGIEIVR